MKYGLVNMYNYIPNTNRINNDYSYTQLQMKNKLQHNTIYDNILQCNEIIYYKANSIHNLTPLPYYFAVLSTFPCTTNRNLTSSVGYIIRISSEL